MPQRRTPVAAPSSYVRGGWPGGRLDADAPPEARYAQVVALRLRHALDETTVTAVAAEADLARGTLYGIINGSRWPDLVSLARLENALGVRLWPDN
jgi:hypothetical protein